MSNSARFDRRATIAALMLYPVLAGLWMVTLHMPADSTLVTAGALVFLCAQISLAVWAIGVWKLLRSRTPVLGGFASGLLFISAFGHAVSAGDMMARPDALVTDPLPVGLTIIAPATMVGLVLGTILLAVALFRAGLGAGWIAGVLLGWVTAEFFLGGLGVWATIASAALLMVACVGLAVVVGRSDVRDWTTVSEWTDADEAAPVRVGR